MSIELMTRVWKVGPAGASERLVLLTIADHSNEKGYSYPGVQLIAERSCQSTRNALRVIAKLERDGWLTVERRSAGASQKGNSYHLNLARLHTEPGKPRPRDMVSRGRVKDAANIEVLNASCDIVSPELSGDTSGGFQVTSGEVQVTSETFSGDKSRIPIRKNHQEPSGNHQDKTTPPTPLSQGGRGAARMGRRGEPMAERPAECLAERPAERPAECPAGLDAQVARVMASRGFTRRRLGLAIGAAMRCAVEGGETPERVADAMIASHAEYVRDGPLLRFRWGEVNFFEENHWRNRQGWPYDAAKVAEMQRASRSSVGMYVESPESRVATEQWEEACRQAKTRLPEIQERRARNEELSDAEFAVILDAENRAARGKPALSRAG